MLDESRPRPFKIPPIFISSHLQIVFHLIPVDVVTQTVPGCRGRLRLSDDSPRERERSRVLLEKSDPALLLVSLSSDGGSNCGPGEREDVGITFGYPRFPIDRAVREIVKVGDVERDEVVRELGDGGREEMEVGEES